MIAYLRTLPLSTKPARIDREAGVIHGVSVIQTGMAAGHGFLIDDKMLAQVAALGAQSAAGVKARFTHPGMCDDGLGKMLGRVKNFSVAGDKVVGDLHLGAYAANSPEGDLRDYMLTMAEEDPQGLGLSIVFKNDPVWKLSDGSEVPAIAEGDEIARPKNAAYDHPHARAAKLHAVDAVDEPAANREGLLAEAFANTSSVAAASAFAELDRLRDHFGLSVPAAQKFLARYFAARAPHQPAGAKPAKERAMLTPETLAELCEANPNHQGVIVKMFAAGKDHDEIVASLTDTKRAEATAALNAQVNELTAAAAADQKTHADALAAKDAALAALEGKLAALTKERDDLAKLGALPKDPGEKPNGKKPEGDDTLAIKELSPGTFSVDSTKIKTGKRSAAAAN